jgi:hypothetical protein
MRLDGPVEADDAVGEFLFRGYEQPLTVAVTSICNEFVMPGIDRHSSA